MSHPEAPYHIQALQPLGRKDSKGIRWLQKVLKDTPPKKLLDIPTEPPNNEVDFTFWEPFNGKISSGFTLYTSIEEYRYWADVGSICWLNAAERRLVPVNSIFVMKHTKGPCDTQAT